MKRTCTALLLTSAVFAMFGCTDDRSEPDEVIGEALSLLETDNALNPNALNPNALNPNALNPNALNPNALNPNALSPDALAAITDPGPAGDLSRQHLRYTVGCALDSTQSFSFTWTDIAQVVHQETYWGILGLATSWISKPLSPTGQRWISACLAARTNYFGVTVMISSRGYCPSLNKHNTPEEDIYTKEEGAFWGNLYANPPALYACHVPANNAHSRAQLRDCAAGYIDPTTGTTQSCGVIQRLGSCDTYCSTSGDASTGHWSCWTDPANEAATTNQQPITVFLQ